MADLPAYPDTGDDNGPGPDRASPPGTPRWVKAFGIAFLVLVLLFGIMVASGHGPGRHLSGGGPGDQTPVSSVTENAMQQP
jgi:hypothetical protein